MPPFSRSHPVEIECPNCRHRFPVPLCELSLGDDVPCGSCRSQIQIATPAIRQLLQQIDTDLDTPQDLPILLRPIKFRSAVATPDAEGETST